MLGRAIAVGLGREFLGARWTEDRRVLEAGIAEAEDVLEQHREHLALRIERRIGEMLDKSM